MKKVVKILIMAFAISLCLTLGIINNVEASASSYREGGEYVISNSSDGYTLSYLGETVIFDSINDSLGAISNPGVINFSYVSCDELIILPQGEYEISGKLHSNGMVYIPADAKVTMRDMTVTLGKDSYIRIKGGSLSIASSSISGDDRIIKLDYSASSRLEVISGRISGDTDEALIDIECGQAIIRGADIENGGGVAIRSDSELCLMGSPKISGAIYGILLESPIYMGAYSNEYYSQTPLSIQYMEAFSQGTLTEIFYEVNERSLSNITLYDKNGKEEKITHFESSRHTSEKKFAGIYLPHTVKFFVGDNLVAEQKLLSGEKISPVISDDIVGYEFDNWYKDREGTDVYTSDKRVYSSFSLYGIYSLDAPTFGISSLDFTYDGQERTLAFDYLSHPIEGGYYTYKWYKNGVEISDLSQINVKNVLDSGTYSCRVTYNLLGDSATVFAENIKVNIEKQTVSLPSIPTVKYNGLPQYPSINVNNLYSVDMIYGIDVGTYPVVITLADANNFSWDGTISDSINLDFEILKADNSWVSIPYASDFYIGFPLVASAVSRFGTVEFIYSATENGAYTSSIPTSIGTYYVKAIVQESENYSSLVSDPIRFCILAEEVVGLQLVKSPDKSEYMSFDTFDPEGMEVAAIYNSGRREVISSSRLSYTYNDGKSLRVGDAAVVVEYSGASLPIPISVAPLTYDLSSITFSGAIIIYDGKYHTIPFSMGSMCGLDGVPLVCETYGGGTDVGEYQVKVKFSTESRDYTTPEAIVATLTILPKTVELVWDCQYFVYDSTPKIPSASFTDAMGVKRSVFVCGSAILAGSGYSATAVEYSDNYVFSNPSCLFDIAKADYDMSSAFWSGTEFIYSGELIEVTVSNLPIGVSVAGYTDNRARDVGKYVATASLRYDERNYNAPHLVSFEWEIKPVEYDMSSLQFFSAEYEYDGNEHFPSVSGTVPVGADGIALSYTFSDGAMNVVDGEVLVAITFMTDSKNYIAPDTIFRKVKIIPKGIYVVWSHDSFTYDGNIKTPIAECHIAPLTVSGGKIDAGSYVASAESEDSNYVVINSTYDYKIEKATNYWISYPSIIDFYESGSPSPSAISLYGNAEFRYYQDDTLSTPVTDIYPGEYFMVAIVQEGDNYLPLTSSPIRFNCIEVVPTEMYAEISGELIAFSGVEDSLLVYLIYNDGTKTSIPIESVSVKYQHGESLRCKDTHIEISYIGFETSIPIKVNPSAYDTSLVYWENAEVEYDGFPHTPSISGLPDGISIIEYIGVSGVSAGKYPFSVVLSYDEENYLPPEVPQCTMIIRKAILPCVPDVTVEYNGKALELESNDFYFPTYESEIKNSGEYTIRYRLADEHNYIFENGTFECISTITVLPRQIKVVVSDSSIHWLEGSPMYSARIEGEIVEGDSVDLEYYIEGDRIYAKCDNKNYFLNIESGTLKRLPYPNEYLRGKIIATVLSLITVILLIVIVFKKRSNILDAVYMLRAKNKHKHGIGYINNAPSTALAPSDTPSHPITINLSTNVKDISSSVVSIDQVTGSIVLSAQIESLPPKISQSKICIESYRSEEKILSQSTHLIDSRNSPIDENSEIGIIEDSSDNKSTDEEIEGTTDKISLHDTENTDLDVSLDIVDDPNVYNNSMDALSESSKKEESFNEIEDEDDIYIASYDIEGKLDDELESLTEDYLDIKEGDSIDPIYCDSENHKIEEPRVEIKMEYANAAITDTMARRLIKDDEEVICTNGKEKSIINVDTLSRNFIADDRVDVNILKKKSLIPYDTGYIKVLARGAIDKPLKVLANEFSLSAVKMILLSGGEAIRVTSKNEEKIKQTNKNKTNK